MTFGPARRPLLAVAGTVGWDIASTDPHAFAAAILPTTMATCLLLTGSPEYLVVSVSGLDCRWEFLGRAQWGSGAVVNVETQVGYNKDLIGSSTGLTVDWVNLSGAGGTAQYLVRLHGPRVRVVSAPHSVHGGSGSLVLGPTVAAPEAGIAVCFCYCRGGTPVLPAGGWIALPGIGAGAGAAWKPVAAGEVVNATWTGPTDNSGGAIILLAPSPTSRAA